MNPWLIVKESRHGRGVFAARRFRTGDVIEECPTLHVPPAEITGTLRDYVFSSLDGRENVLALGYGMLYNHAADPNVEYDQDRPDLLRFFALRTIRAGEELTIDYGEEWWETRGLTPD